MTILEPTTAITDFILAVECFVFGHFLFWKYANSFKHIKAFALFFLFLGFGSLFGGISHGFHYLTENYSWFGWIWVLTILSIGKASFYLGGAIVLRFFDKYQKILLPLLAFKFLILVLVVFGVMPGELVQGLYNEGRPRFLIVILDYAPVQFLFLVMIMYHFLKTRQLHFAKIASGILLSFFGSMIQIAKLAPHENFNHNDLFHVIQMFALFLMYQGIVDEVLLLKKNFKSM